MQWMSTELKDFLRYNFGLTNFGPADPRLLNQDDRLGWDKALDKQPRGAERTRENIRKLIRNRNPVKWIQVQNDIKWVKKEMKKMGLNPEDWRSVL